MVIGLRNMILECSILGLYRKTPNNKHINYINESVVKKIATYYAAITVNVFVI